MNPKRVILVCIVMLPLIAQAVYAASDSDIMPNRIQTTPSPQQAPRAKLTTVPAASSGDIGSEMSPEEGSAMGLGISIPLGRRKPRPQPTQTEDDDSATPQPEQQ